MCDFCEHAASTITLIYCEKFVYYCWDSKYILKVLRSNLGKSEKCSQVHLLTEIGYLFIQLIVKFEYTELPTRWLGLLQPAKWGETFNSTG